jgi:formylglycine-generating enzyme required for sulfatase activity
MIVLRRAVGQEGEKHLLLGNRELEAKMKRYAILVLFALVTAACGALPTLTVDLVPTRLVAEATAPVTMTVPAPTAAKPTNTSAPAPTSIPTKAATQGSIPTPNPEVETLIRDQDGMTMVYVPEGDFVMGTPAGAGGDDEGPEHSVTLDAFWIDRTEVTNAQYRAFVEATGHREPTTCASGEPTYDDATKANRVRELG